MKTRLLSLFAALAACLASPAWADGAILPGNPDKADILASEFNETQRSRV